MEWLHSRSHRPRRAPRWTSPARTSPWSSRSRSSPSIALVMGFVFRQQVLRRRPRHREDAGDRRCRRGGRPGVPRAPVQDARRSSSSSSSACCSCCPPTPAGVRSAAPASSSSARVFSAAIGYLGMSLAVKANVRVASAARGRERPRRGHADRLPHRRHRRHGDRGPRPARRLRRRPPLQGRRPQGARGLRLRRRPARDVHACRRRHLHQGRRRRRRPRRQGRGRHPRGRPAQRRDDRRQRRRQRRRLRRHGGRPLRVVCRHARRRAHPRLGRLRRATAWSSR